MPRSQRQATKLAQLRRHVREHSLQHDHVAGAQLDIAQSLREALAAAADGEQVDSEAVVQEQAPGRLADQQ